MTKEESEEIRKRCEEVMGITPDQVDKVTPITPDTVDSITREALGFFKERETLAKLFNNPKQQ